MEEQELRPAGRFAAPLAGLSRCLLVQRIRSKFHLFPAPVQWFFQTAILIQMSEALPCFAKSGRKQSSHPLALIQNQCFRNSKTSSRFLPAHPPPPFQGDCRWKLAHLLSHGFLLQE